MDKIIDVIKSYNEYTYDHILDVYSKTKCQDILFYCKVKSEKLEIPDIIGITGKKYEEVFLYIFNIQRMLDGLYKVYSYDEMYQEIGAILSTDDNDDNILDDFDF